MLNNLPPPYPSSKKSQNNKSSLEHLYLHSPSSLLHTPSSLLQTPSSSHDQQYHSNKNSIITSTFYKTSCDQHTRIRINKWIKKLNSKIQINNNLWRKNRNNYIKVLALMCQCQIILEPFIQMPSEGDLPKLNKCQINKIIDEIQMAVKNINTNAHINSFINAYGMIQSHRQKSSENRNQYKKKMKPSEDDKKMEYNNNYTKMKCSQDDRNDLKNHQNISFNKNNQLSIKSQQQNDQIQERSSRQTLKTNSNFHYSINQENNVVHIISEKHLHQSQKNDFGERNSIKKINQQKKYSQKRQEEKQCYEQLQSNYVRDNKENLIQTRNLQSEENQNHYRFKEGSMLKKSQSFQRQTANTVNNVNIVNTTNTVNTANTAANQRETHLKEKILLQELKIQQIASSYQTKNNTKPFIEINATKNQSKKGISDIQPIKSNGMSKYFAKNMRLQKRQSLKVEDGLRQSSKKDQKYSQMHQKYSQVHKQSIINGLTNSNKSLSTSNNQLTLNYKHLDQPYTQNNNNSDDKYILQSQFQQSINQKQQFNYEEQSMSQYKADMLPLQKYKYFLWKSKHTIILQQCIKFIHANKHIFRKDQQFQTLSDDLQQLQKEQSSQEYLMKKDRLKCNTYLKASVFAANRLKQGQQRQQLYQQEEQQKSMQQQQEQGQYQKGYIGEQGSCEQFQIQGQLGSVKQNNKGMTSLIKGIK